MQQGAQSETEAEKLRRELEWLTKQHGGLQRRVEFVGRRLAGLAAEAVATPDDASLATDNAPADDLPEAPSDESPPPKIEQAGADQPTDGGVDAMAAALSRPVVRLAGVDQRGGLLVVLIAAVSAASVVGCWFATREGRLPPVAAPGVLAVVSAAWAGWILGRCCGRRDG